MTDEHANDLWTRDGIETQWSRPWKNPLPAPPLADSGQ
jgi:hypothetical protein